jgi:hypothetical protein
MGTPASQYITPAAREHIEKLVAESRNKAKQVIPGRPNPNIGMGLKTPSDQPQFGEIGWVNPNFDIYHNADGYHRFDPTIPGMGMQMSRTYADGANAYDVYQQRSPNTMYARYSRQFLAENGIDAATATDIQKYAAMDYAGRLGQWKNQRPKRKFGIKDAFGLALSVGAIFTGNPYLAAGMAAGGSALRGGDIGDIALAAGTSFAFPNSGSSDLITAGKLGLAGYQSLASSGVNLSPDQYSLREGGNRKITTFEPENKNIAFSAHPTSSYLAAYPGAPASTETTASPITTTPAAPIAGTETAARPYVAPTRIPIAPNIPIVNYDPSRNYAQLTQQSTPRASTMQQALMRPAATRRRSQNVRTA